MTNCEKHRHQTRANMSKITRAAIQNRIGQGFLFLFGLISVQLGKKKKKTTLEET